MVGRGDYQVNIETILQSRRTRYKYEEIPLQHEPSISTILQRFLLIYQPSLYYSHFHSNMQFFAIIPAILAVAVSAAPTQATSSSSLVASIKAQADSALTQLEAAGCDKLSEILFLTFIIYPRRHID